MGGAGADGYERSEGAAVIKMIYIILTLVSGILLSGVWFGLNFLIQICVEKSKVKFLERYSVIATISFHLKIQQTGIIIVLLIGKTG